MKNQLDQKQIYEQYLVGCIGKQCAQTKQQIDRYKHCFANNRHSSGFAEVWKQITFALTIQKAENVSVYDLDGNAYLDITMGFGVHLFGHSPRFVQEAVAGQLQNGMALGPVYVHAAETAALLCQVTGNERCAFFNSGTEAVMVALRLARAATGKNKIVIFEGAYHGTHDSVLVMKQHPATQEAIASIPGIVPSLVQDTILIKFGDESSIRFMETHALEIAAVMTEPVRSRHLEEVNPHFLHEVQKVCKDNNIAFILDEIVTGFRVANGGAKELFALDPDMVTYGKILGGGFPIGVVAGKKKYLDFIDGGGWKFTNEDQPFSATTFVAGTFCHHPLAMAAAKAVLTHLQAQENKLQHRLNDKTARFCGDINAFCVQNGMDVRLVHFASVFRFLVKGKNRILYHALLKEKVYIWEGRTCFLSTEHGEQELAILKRKIVKCLLEMKAAGFFFKPGSAERPPGQAAGGFLQAGIRIGEVLNKDWLALAFHYTCENISQSTQAPFPGKVHLDPLTPVDVMQRPDGHDSVVHLVINYEGGHTKLFLYGSKDHVDGWSLTLILRYLGTCYKAIEENDPLPFNTFMNKADIEGYMPGNGKMNRTTPSPAFTVNRYIPPYESLTVYRGVLFEFLLATFARALGNGTHVIGVPFSGQLASRQLNAVGAYTCHIPVRLTVSAAATVASLMESVSLQLKEGKRNFMHWYQNEVHCPIVFNMDNLLRRFLFGTREFRFLHNPDAATQHTIVCNVVAEPNGLHISIKYKKEQGEEGAEAAEDLINHFCTLLTTGQHVPAPREY